MQQSMANLDKIKRMVLPGLFPPFAHARKQPGDARAETVVSPVTCVAVNPHHQGSRPLYFQAPELGRVEQLLDLGGGPGRVASLLKEGRPDLKVTVFDTPFVSDQALALFRERGQQEDLGAHPGNLFTDPFPSGFHALQFSHVLELYSPEMVLQLRKKSFESLPRSGKLIVYGHAAAEDHTLVDTSTGALPWLALFAAGSSRLYSVGAYQRWLRAVGFSRITVRHDGARTFFLIAIK